jgi:hypothetical protein
MSRLSATLLASLLLAPAGLAQHAPEDFARGLRIEVAAADPVQALEIPREVYRVTTRADLADLRVFNGLGEELPHAVVQTSPPATRERQRGVPVFPVHGPADAPLDGLIVEMLPSPAGTETRVITRSGPSQERPLRAYLVDLRALDEAAQGMLLFWPEDAADFVAQVHVETSDDLQRWTPWGREVTIAHLRYAQNTLRRDEIALPPRSNRYARLTWSGGTALPPLDSVRVTTGSPALIDREWARLEGTTTAAHHFSFDQEGLLPVDRAAIELPQMNSLARVALESAPAPAGPWTDRFSGLAYRLMLDGQEVTADAVTLPVTSDRYWRVRADPAGGGIGTAPPALRLGWVPQRLLFVPRGEGPFTLAFGSAAASGAAFAPEELLNLVPAASGAPAHATIVGESFELGGSARLTPDRRVPWSQIALWGVLILGAALLAAMTIRLLRQVDRQRGAEPG